MATPRCGPDPCLFEWQHQTVSWLLFVWMATPRCALILACVNGNAQMCPDCCLCEWQLQDVLWSLFVWMATLRCILILVCVNGNASVCVLNLVLWVAMAGCTLNLVGYVCSSSWSCTTPPPRCVEKLYWARRTVRQFKSKPLLSPPPLVTCYRYMIMISNGLSLNILLTKHLMFVDIDSTAHCTII